jgi:hypothetical protein
MKWFWLSFADPGLPIGEQFLGVAIIAIDEVATNLIDALDPTDRIELLRSRGQESDVPFYAAIQMASLAGINPGGEVQGYEITEHIDKVPEDARGRLLSRDELEKTGLMS